MLHRLDTDLEFFRETSARFLDEFATPQELRRLRDDPAGFDPDYWRRGADLGWTSLMVDERHGGGSISGDRHVDLAVLAHEFGARAAPGPLVSTNVAAATLSHHDAHTDILGQLLSGDTVATWAIAEGPPHDRPGDEALEISLDGDELVLDGTKRPVESAHEASHMVVTGRTGSGLTQVLVATDHPGVTMTRMSGVDLTRRFSQVSFSDVRVPVGALIGEMGGAAADVARQRRLALVMLNSESVGAMQTAFDMTLEWAVDRYSFGRPLASYQAIKHRFADMSTWLEASHALADEATAAVAADAPDADALLSAAKAFIGDYGSELLQECVQLHGGIGLTFEHDLHLTLRRHTTNRGLLGTPADHRRLVARSVAEQERSA